MSSVRIVAEPTFTVEIYIAGNMIDIERACAEYCRAGLCVSIEAVKYVYTGGREDGAVVRLVNYPRFPAASADILEKAIALAERLIRDCCQTSALVVDHIRTYWVTTRDA